MNNRLKIAGRARDNLEYSRRCCLLVQCLCQGLWSDWRSSLSSRVFSMAMTAWSAKTRYQLDLLVGKGANFLAVNTNHAD